MNKRTKAQREADMEAIARMYLTGKTQRYIAKIIGVSQPMIKREIDRLRKRWRDSADTCFDDAQADQLARIDNLESTYWEAWEESREKKSKIVTEKAGSGEGARRAKVQTTEEERDGNPKFLEGVQWCIAERSKVLGVNAPTKLSSTSPDGKEQGPPLMFWIPDNGRDPGIERPKPEDFSGA